MGWSELYSLESLAVGTHWSPTVRLFDGKEDHAFECVVTGSGTVTVTPFTSISGEHFVSNGSKLTGFGATGGPGSDGKQNIPLLLRPGELIQFKVEVSSDTVVFSMWFTQK